VFDVVRRVVMNTDPADGGAGIAKLVERRFDLCFDVVGKLRSTGRKQLDAVVRR